MPSHTLKSKRSRGKRSTRSKSQSLNTILHKLCKRNFFNILPNEYEQYKQKIRYEFENNPELINQLNKKRETPLDLLCKQYINPKNNEKYMGTDDRQSLLELIEDLNGTYGAELNKCSL